MTYQDQTIEQAVDSILEEASKTATGAAPAETPAATKEAEIETAESDRRMELIETYTGERISSEVIFAESRQELDRRNKKSPEYMQRLAEVATFYRLLIDGKRTMEQLRENMMSSEFTALLGDTLDRVLLAKYETYAPTYRRFLRIRSVRDFRAVGAVRRHGGKGLKPVPESGTYPQSAVEASNYTFSVSKYGMTYGLTWEMFINDDLDAFRSLPDDMVDDAIQEEMRFASSLYVANTTLYNNTHAVGGTNYNNKATAKLTIAALKAAYEEMLKFPGDIRHNNEKRPLNNVPVMLVVHPVQAITASEILGSLIVQATGGGATTVILPTTNGMSGRLEIVPDPYIAVLDATNGFTSWYLFAEPNRIHAAEFGFLRGYEQPQLFQELPSQIRMGGGSAGVDGSFDDDVTRYKIRHVFGGSHANATGGWRGTYWSDGTV